MVAFYGNNQQELFDGYSPKDDALLRLVLDRLCRDLEIRSELVEYTIREEELISCDDRKALGTYLVVQVVAASKPSCEGKSRSAYDKNYREIGTSIWCGLGIGMIFAGSWLRCKLHDRN